MVVMPSKLNYREEKTPVTNLSEILTTSAIHNQTILKHCAAADSCYFNKLNRTRLDEDDILTSISKLPNIPLQSANFNVSLN